MKFDYPSVEFVAEFWKLISQAKAIIITSHTSPDDDSIGSVLATFWIIKSKYPKKVVKIIYTGNFDNRYSYFEGYDQVSFLPDIADQVGDADLMIMLDGSQYSRFTKDGEKLKKFKGKTICIDHHSSPPDNFDLLLLLPNFISTCQIIYKGFYEAKEVPKNIAEPMLLGLLGDTGNFTYIRPSDLEIFDMAKKLVESLQVPIQEFMSKYNVIAPKIFQIVKEYMVNTKFEELPGWDNYSWTFLSRECTEREVLSDNNLSEAAHIYMDHYLRTIANCPWGFIITPKSDGSCSISFRSLPKHVNVRSVVETMRIGGGHDRASGGTFKSINGEKVNPLKCYEQLKVWMNSNKQPTS